MQKLLIGIAGRARVGKDTAAHILKNQLNLKSYTLADPVTTECAALLNIPHDAFLAMDKNSRIDSVSITDSNNEAIYQKISHDGQQQMLSALFTSTTKRRLMQTVGHCLRYINPNMMLESLQHRIDCDELHSHNYGGIIVTDIRLEAEAEWIRGHGGHLIHIINPNAEPAPSDITEQDIAIRPRDYIIRNIGSKRTFEAKVIGHSSILKQLSLSA